MPRVRRADCEGADSRLHGDRTNDRVTKRNAGSAPVPPEEVRLALPDIAGCPAQLMRRMEYFAHRKALDIESLGGIVAENSSSAASSRSRSTCST